MNIQWKPIAGIMKNMVIAIIGQAIPPPIVIGISSIWSGLQAYGRAYPTIVFSKKTDVGSSIASGISEIA